MTIQHTTENDLPLVMQIYERARTFMINSGNATQWPEGYPPEHLIRADIQQKKSYICRDASGTILCVFYFAIEDDPTYREIQGSWLNNRPYGVIHRIASSGAKSGMVKLVTDWCKQNIQDLRIDTHEDNHLMKKSLQTAGFVYCGIIYVLNRSERCAYQWTAE